MKLKSDHINRCGIFLFFDPDGVVDDYIIYLLKTLKEEVGEILTVCNGYVQTEGLQRLREASDDVICRANVGLDVGGYREGLFYLGFKKLGQFDELVLFNYTFFGPLYPWQEMFQEMAERDVDFWGISRHHAITPDPWGKNRYGYIPEHIQSYFLVLRPSLFMSYQYRDFIMNMKNPATYLESICEYETIFTKYFSDLDFRWDVYMNTDAYEGYSYTPIMYYIKELIEEQRCPVIKRRNFFNEYSDYLLNGCGQPSMEAYRYLCENSLYPVDYIWDNLLRLENIGDIYKNLHLNYILTSYASHARDEETRTAVFVVVDSAKWAGQYKKYLAAIPEMTDLYVVGSEVCVCEFEKRTEKDTSRPYKAIHMENTGWKSLFEEIGRNAKGQYELVGILKMRSVEDQQPYSNAVSWQYSDWENMAGTEHVIKNIEETFLKNPRLGCLIPPIPNFGDLFARMGDGWMGRFDQVKDLLKRWGVKNRVKRAAEPLSPIGGSFWVRPELLHLPADSGENHPDEETFLLAFPYWAQSRGYYTGVGTSDDYAENELTNLDYMLRENNKTVFGKYGANLHVVDVQRIRNSEFLQEETPV